LKTWELEKGSYDMVVSSPGVERKLKTLRHFEMAIGELIKIKL
jgi:ribosome maturation factor RimP